MNRQLKYLHVKYDPRTQSFLKTANPIIRDRKTKQAGGLTQNIIDALNREKIVLEKIRGPETLQKEFPIAGICYDKTNDDWFVHPKHGILPVENLLDIRRQDLDAETLQEFTDLMNLRVETALDESRFDKMLEWLDAYTELRNDFSHLVGKELIQPLLFSITKAVKTLAEIGNKELIDDFKDRFVKIKFETTETARHRGKKELLSPAEKRFFEEQARKAVKKNKVYTLCDAFEKNGGDVEKTLKKIASVKDVNTDVIVPALLNLRANHLIGELQRYHHLEVSDPGETARFESMVSELENLVGDERVTASHQILAKLKPLILSVSEKVFLSPKHPIEIREKYFDGALGKVPQKQAYANLQLMNVLELAVAEIQQMNETQMERHLAFYKRMMEKNFAIFQRSIAQIEREIAEIRKLFRQKKMGLE